MRYEPIGVCAGIVPWNFPLVFVGWKIAPAIAAGNPIVLKPASLTPLTALTVAESARGAGLPPGVLNVVLGPGEVVGEALASSPDVDKVSFHGVHRGGTARDGARRRHGEARHARARREVGEHPHRGRRPRRCGRNRALHDLRARRAGVRIGIACARAPLDSRRARRARGRAGAEHARRHPLDPATDIGPLTSPARAEHVDRYVEIGRRKVGDPLVGGGRPSDVGGGLDGSASRMPTVFADVPNRSRIAQEEIFGPVLCLMPFETDDEAVELAYDTIYGLVAGVQSRDIERARAVANRLRAGTVWINDWHMFDYRRPFGGYKQSGVGREHGVRGYDAYRQKHVHTNPVPGREAHPHYALLSTAA